MKNLINKVKIYRVLAIIIPILYMLFSNDCKNITGALGLMMGGIWMLVNGKFHKKAN